jgi:glycosyltransferase involved in cell wall biosynthesis
LEHQKKILYLTYDGLSDPLGQSQILPYLLGLNEIGHSITIVSSEKKNNPELVREITRKLKDCNIHWINISYTKSPIILSTIFDIFRMLRVCLRLCVKEKFDIVHCRSYITSLIGLFLKKHFKIAFVFDPRGLYADERIDGGIWNQKYIIYRLIYRFFKRREAAFLKNADYTVCLTEDARTEIQSWKSIRGQPLPIMVIPCCADTDLFDYNRITTQEREDVYREMNLSPDDFILSYVGTVGTWYMLDEMLDFFSRMLLQYPSAKFFFITHEDPSFILNKVEQKNIPRSNIRIKKTIHNQVPKYLSISRLSIFFIKPLYSKKASSPVKQGEIMSMGIPVICNSNIGDTGRIIRKFSAGSIVRSFTDDDYDFIVSDIPMLLNLSKEKLRNSAIDIFSLEKGIGQYNMIYMGLSN